MSTQSAILRADVVRRPSLPGPLPGILLCIAVTGAAFVVQDIERIVFGRAWLEALVLAILIGATVRTFWSPSSVWKPGVDFSAKILLEVAVVLLGVSMSAETLLAAGPRLLIGIPVIVAAAIGGSLLIGRMLGLPSRLAVLVACGNSICGNSAIAAVAPVIGASGEEVASSIAFTAVLGVIVVLGLPLIAIALHLSALRFGALSGLTVYAVPQVIAAAAPLGSVAVQMGTLVKLVRVLMLGPVCLLLGLAAPRLQGSDRDAPLPRLSLRHLVPWFIAGFLAMLALRSLDLIPSAFIAPAGHVATLLTVVSMAGLGLGVDIRTVARAGGRVTLTVVASLLFLGATSLGFLSLVHIG